jgi:CHASE2 domain-containing sensor protein
MGGRGGKRDGRADAADGRPALMSWLQGLAGAASVLVVLALLFVPAAAQLALDYFQQYTGDKRTALLSPRAPATHPQVAMVTITEETLQGYKSVSPVDRGLLARIVAALDAAGAKAIGLDILFLRPTEAAPDEALIQALRSARTEVVLGALDERGDLLAGQRAFQADFLARAGRSVGYLNLRHDKDLVVRSSAPPHAGSAYPRSFARQLAAAGGSDQPDRASPISWLLPPARPGEAGFVTIPAHRLLAGDPELARQLGGKIVLVGGDFPNRDRHRTPLAPDKDEDFSGLFIHAQITAAKLEPQRTIWQLDAARERMLLMALAIVGFAIGWRMWDSDIVNLIGWTFATAALIAADAAAFVYAHLLLPFTLALLAWFLGVTAGRFLRGFSEHVLARRDSP